MDPLSQWDTYRVRRFKPQTSNQIRVRLKVTDSRSLPMP